jgi:ABC-type amino acid transport substrate-binding protein
MGCAARFSAAFIVGAGCLAAGGSPATARPLDNVVASGTIKIAVYRDNPPFSFRRQDALAGIDVEIGRRVAGSLSVTAEFMEVTADESVDDDLRNAVWKGHPLWGKVVADLMLSIPYDRTLGERNPDVVLFAPYAEEHLILVGDPQRMAGEQTLASLRGNRIGVEIDTLPDFFLTTTMNGALRGSVVHFPTTEAAAGALADGTVAGVMATRSRLEGALGPRIAELRFAPADLRGFGREHWTLGIAVKENSRDLGYAAGDVIAELIASGEMAAIFRAYGLSYHPPEL